MRPVAQIQDEKKRPTTSTKELKVNIPARLLLELQNEKIAKGELIASSVEKALRSYLRSLR